MPLSLKSKGTFMLWSLLSLRQALFKICLFWNAQLERLFLAMLIRKEKKTFEKLFKINEIYLKVKFIRSQFSESNRSHQHSQNEEPIEEQIGSGRFSVVSCRVVSSSSNYLAFCPILSNTHQSCEFGQNPTC